MGKYILLQGFFLYYFILDREDGLSFASSDESAFYCSETHLIAERYL